MLKSFFFGLVSIQLGLGLGLDCVGEGGEGRELRVHNLKVCDWFGLGWFGLCWVGLLLDSGGLEIDCLFFFFFLQFWVRLDWVG